MMRRGIGERKAMYISTSTDSTKGQRRVIELQAVDSGMESFNAYMTH